MILQTPVHEHDTTVWQVVQVIAAIVVAVIGAVARKLPNWLGFLFMLLASALIIVVGFATQAYRFLPLGFACLIGTVIAWIAGASFKPEGEDDTLGGTAEYIPWWAWLIIAVLIVVAIIIGLAVLH